MTGPAPLPEERAGAPLRAMVTGSDSGTGAATAVALAGGGADLGITDRSMALPRASGPKP